MIRKAERKDINRMAEIETFVSRYNFKGLFSNEFLYTEITFDYNRDWISKSFNYMENNRRTEYYVIEDEKIIKGWFSIGFSENSNEINECVLTNIRIDVPFQYSKFGTLALDFCFTLMKEKGIKIMRLHTFEGNTMAIKFYEKNGFKFESKYYSEKFNINFLNYKKELE